MRVTQCQEVRASFDSKCGVSGPDLEQELALGQSLHYCCYIRIINNKEATGLLSFVMPLYSFFLTSCCFHF